MATPRRLIKVEIDGEWWAVDKAGAWYRWSVTNSDWVPSPSPPRDNMPVPTRSERTPVHHWAADPQQRAIFIAVSAVVIFVVGLGPIAIGFYDIKGVGRCLSLHGIRADRVLPACG